MKIVSAIQPKLFQTEIDLAARRPNNLSAYYLYLRALSHLYSWTRGGSAEALQLVSRALEINPRYGICCDPCRELPPPKCTSGVGGR